MVILTGAVIAGKNMHKYKPTPSGVMERKLKRKKQRLRIFNTVPLIGRNKMIAEIKWSKGTPTQGYCWPLMLTVCHRGA